jgi:predicted nucleic-acid-binding protein
MIAVDINILVYAHQQQSAIRSLVAQHITDIVQQVQAASLV